MKISQVILVVAGGQLRRCEAVDIMGLLCSAGNGSSVVYWRGAVSKPRVTGTPVEFLVSFMAGKSA